MLRANALSLSHEDLLSLLSGFGASLLHLFFMRRRRLSSSRPTFKCLPTNDVSPSAGFSCSRRLKAFLGVLRPFLNVFSPPPSSSCVMRRRLLLFSTFKAFFTSAMHSRPLLNNVLRPFLDVSSPSSSCAAGFSCSPRCRTRFADPSNSNSLFQLSFPRSLN